MQNKIDSLHKQFQTDLDKATTLSALEQLKVKFLGKKGPIQDLMKALREIPQEQRPEVGKQINSLKEELENTLSIRETAMRDQVQAQQLEQERIDITLPGRRRFLGNKHIITQTLDQIIDIFIGMGFSVQYGPEIDTDYYNFEALNFAADHPARDMQDTCYIDDHYLLRTQMTTVQARILELESPPIRIIAPGKVYRNETITSRSHVLFQQLDGVYVDTHVTFSDLIATFTEFLQKLFSPDIQIRFRPSYFPFVEPGMEIDIACLSCKGEGCALCKNAGWLEIAGGGMIHPEVLKNGNIDPENYSGYAWGMGVGRLAMMRYGIPDIRLFFENDLRFLEQFSPV